MDLSFFISEIVIPFPPTVEAHGKDPVRYGYIYIKYNINALIFIIVLFLYRRFICFIINDEA